jgi:hypothetical protein
VLVPERRERGDGRAAGLEPLPAAAALRLVAPHALWQMSLEPDVELVALRRLLTSVPCFRMVLSDDRSTNPGLVQEALAAGA